MKSLLSIIHLQTNSVSGEKIAVGLLGISGKEVFFQHSELKLKLVSRLSAPEVMKHAELSFELIANKVADTNKELKNHELLKSEHAFTKEYIQYLNKYSKGLLQFDLPKSFAGDLDKKVFKQLFQQFIGVWEEKAEEPKRKPVQFHTAIKRHLKNSVFAEKADIDYKLQPEKITGILLPQDITMISKNGSILAAQPIDFTNSLDIIGKHAYELEVIFNSLEKFGRDHIKKNHRGNYYLLFNKPAKSSEQEKLLNEIKRSKSGLMNIEEAGYLEELEHKLEKENYNKFSLFAETI